MKTLEIKSVVKHIVASSITIFIILFALSNRFSFADTCPADVEATMPPNQETLDSAYQPPPPDDPNILHRYRFVPPNASPNNQ
jgi:hypothetical protein